MLNFFRVLCAEVGKNMTATAVSDLLLVAHISRRRRARFRDCKRRTCKYVERACMYPGHSKIVTATLPLGQFGDGIM